MKIFVKGPQNIRILSKAISWRKEVDNQKRHTVLIVIICNSGTPDSLESSNNGNSLCHPQLDENDWPGTKTAAVFLCRFLTTWLRQCEFFTPVKGRTYTHASENRSSGKTESCLPSEILSGQDSCPVAWGAGGGQSSVWEFKAKTSELFCDGLILWPLSLWPLPKKERGKTFLLCAMTCILFQHSTSTKSGPICLFELEMEVWYSGHLLCNVKEGVKFGHFSSTLSPLPGGQRPWAH